jgi:hypothetical protein
MLAIEEGVIEPQATNYMKSLLQRERYGGHGGYGRGLPPGTVPRQSRLHTTRWRRSRLRCPTVDDS